MSLRSAVYVSALLAFAVPAQAQYACGEHDKLVALIADKYGEVPQGLGVSGPNLVEFFLSPTGSWTMMSTNPNGPTCVIASGTDWEMRPPPTKGKPT